MLHISDLHVTLKEVNIDVLSGVDLTINRGEVHVIQGKNGSGKSSLAATIAGNPQFQITQGTIKLTKEDYSEHLTQKLKLKKSIVLNELEPDVRSLLGIFLANQHPPAIPGVNLARFLHLAYNARKEKSLPVFKFRRLLKEKAALINFPEKLLDRNLNEGFSGGERKKTEILQLLILEPRYAILDETDSGLDKEALQEVFLGIKKVKEEYLPNMALLIITHYDKVLEYIKPDFIHQMKDGKLI